VRVVIAEDSVLLREGLAPHRPRTPMSSRRLSAASSPTSRSSTYACRPLRLKDRVLEIDDFLDAVRRVGKGGTAIDPEVISQLLGRKREDSPLDELTPREREVLELMA
jgi:DNA-binding NarL/FixJ family response regulator